MSADEDTELRDLVAQTLEANGVLGKIRAQLRASVFLALEEQDSLQAQSFEERIKQLGQMCYKQNKTPFANADLKQFISTKEGQMVTGLVREFLEHFNLEFTLAVFDPETGCGEHYSGRGALARDLNIVDSEGTRKLPLLAQVLKRSPNDSPSRSKSTSGAEEGVTVGADSDTDSTNIQDLTAIHLSEARQKFQHYDKDNSGTIEKDELRALFSDMFPGFHRNMLDRYVNDEFRAADTDLSNGIDFDEFLGMYKRLFVLCKSVVSNDVSDLVSPRHPAPSKIPSPRKWRKEEDEDSKSSEATGGATSSVDNKNKRNLDGDKKDSKQAFKLPSTDTLQSDPDDDPFFDDPLPINNNTKVFSRGKPVTITLSPRSSPRNPNTPTLPSSPGASGSPTSPRPSKIPMKKSDSSDKQKKDVTFEDNASKKGASAGGASGLTSLAGLPSLTPSEQHNKPSKSPDLEKDIRAIDRKIADLGFDVPDDDYDDDFESSNVSPFGATPRSARSDHNVKSIEDELEDEIEEDLSVAEDLLRSDNSGMDDLTTDRTVSPDNQSSAIDYMEDVMVP